jgi:hypothetical protein
MKKIYFSPIVLTVICGQLFLSCKKETTSESSDRSNQSPVLYQPTVSNRPPVANAGADQTVVLPLNSATLDGSASSDPDSNIVSYSWTQISGPSSGNILTKSAKKTQVNGLVKGSYRFELKISDVTGLSAKDTSLVTVIDATVVSDCGPNRWTQLQYLPANEFFFGPHFWFDGDNFLMGIDTIVYAVSNKVHLWKYDTKTDVWSYAADFPENTNDVPLVFSVKEKGYCYTNGHNWQYTPSTNQWTKKIDPTGSFSAPLVINGKVYLRNASNHIVEYNPVSDSYSVKNNCPVNEELLGNFVMNGYGFYVYSNGQCWQYDAEPDKWHQKASLNVPGTLYNTSSFALGGSGYILGDLDLQTYNFNKPMKLFHYDFASDEWSQCATSDYKGNGAYHISTTSFKDIAYVGLGYTNADFNAIDFWKFQ